MLKPASIAIATALIVGGCTKSMDDSGSAPSAGDHVPLAESGTIDVSRPRPVAEYIFESPRDTIREGEITVDIMELMVPRRFNDLGLRMADVARDNPEWWIEQVKAAKPREPLPYDSRLGMSESEYNEFLSMSTKTTMRKKAGTTLVVSKKADNVYVLDGGEQLPELTGIEIDLENDCVRTEFGVARDRSDIDAPEHSALGPWKGVQWKYEQPGPIEITGTVVKFALGKLTQTGRCVIYYNVKQVSLFGKNRVDYVLNYDLSEED